MAKTTVPQELSSTPNITDNGTATAITIDSSQNATFAGDVVHSAYTKYPANTTAVLTTGGDAAIFAGTDAFPSAINGNLVLQSRPTAGAAIYAYTGATPSLAMTIDGSGRVTTPYQPAFQSELTSSQTITTSAVAIGFNSDDFDTGSNHSNGTFTAPVAGKYAFGVNFLAYPFSTGVLNVGFYVNGVAAPYIVQHGASDNFHTGITLTALLNLAANDAVTVQVSGTGLTSTQVFGGQSYWHGHLVG